MSKQKKLIATVVVVAILLMGIGYAALTATTLTIGGSATATAEQDNFKVYYTGVATKSTDANVAVAVASEDTHAEVTITGLTAAGNKEYAILEITNASNGVDAESVVVTTDGVDSAYFDIEAEMCDASGNAISDNSLAVGAKTYVKVSAELLKTPTGEDVSTTIDVLLTATPKAN